MKKILKRKLLFSEKESKGMVIGYARAIKTDIEGLNAQIKDLQNYGCKMIFAEALNVTEEIKPELTKAFNLLSKGDQFVISSLDIVFSSKNDFINKMMDFLKKEISLKTLSGFFSLSNSPEIIASVFSILHEFDYLERKNLAERKKNIAINRYEKGNLGGRPKISSLKETLVIRLRKEGCSYRSIRSQTGLALSTIRRVILESGSEK